MIYSPVESRKSYGQCRSRDPLSYAGKLRVIGYLAIFKSESVCNPLGI